MDAYIVARDLCPRIPEVPDILRYHKPFRSLGPNSHISVEYTDIAGLRVAGVNIEENNDIEEDSIVIFIWRHSAEQSDQVLSSYFDAVIRSISAYHNSIIWEVTWINEELNIARIRRDPAKADVTYESITQAFNELYAEKLYLVEGGSVEKLSH